MAKKGFDIKIFDLNNLPQTQAYTTYELGRHLKIHIGDSNEIQDFKDYL